MTTTTQEKVGDIILGGHLVRCCHNTRRTPDRKLVLVRSPLQVGRGGPSLWTETQKRPGGWERKVEHVLDTSAEDPTRATSEFEVVRVRKVPPSDPGLMGRDAGYGGGTEITVRRRGLHPLVQLHHGRVGGCTGGVLQEPVMAWPLSGETRSFPAPGTPGAFGTVRKHNIHTGVDLYCPDGTSVFAIEPGVVVAILPFTGEKVGSPWWRDTECVLVQGEHHVLCYGEINPSLDLKVGDTVDTGSLIGWVTRVLKNDKGRPTTMLHLERYTKGTTEPVWWKLGESKPKNLRDPTRLLLKQLMSPVQAQIPSPTPQPPEPLVWNDSMNTTIHEKAGDVVLGAHLIHCHYDTRSDKKGALRLARRRPLWFGEGFGGTYWTKRETMPGGWHREVKMFLPTTASDPTRATSKFRVMSVRGNPVVGDNYAGGGGGFDVIVKRLDGRGERILYNRGGDTTYTCSKPAILATS